MGASNLNHFFSSIETSVSPDFLKFINQKSGRAQTPEYSHVQLHFFRPKKCVTALGRSPRVPLRAMGASNLNYFFQSIETSASPSFLNILNQCWGGRVYSRLISSV